MLRYAKIIGITDSLFEWGEIVYFVSSASAVVKQEQKEENWFYV